MFLWKELTALAFNQDCAAIYRYVYIGHFSIMSYFTPTGKIKFTTLSILLLEIHIPVSPRAGGHQ